MIITRKYAKRLIAQGKAYKVGCTKSGYAILNRLDLHRTDHYEQRTILVIDRICNRNHHRTEGIK